MNDGNGKMIWLDLETTGLDPNTDQILEIACVITDHKLEMLDKLNIVLNPVLDKPDWKPEDMDSYVLDMHTKNGLLSFLPRGVNLEITEKACSDFVLRHFGTPRPLGEVGACGEDRVLPANLPPLCGSSVHFDRMFLKKYMPRFASMFAYRNIDVSTLKELAMRWSPEVFEERPLGAKTHRAMQDIFDSIAELAHYRDEMFV